MRQTKSETLEQHTAVPAISGYIYQLQLACLQLFDLQEGEQLGIEVLDDLHVQRDGAVSKLIQSKYSRSRGNLTSRSRELWKTLGIWARAIIDGSLEISNVRHLVLMTTAGVTAGSVPEMISVGKGTIEVIDALKGQGNFREKKQQAAFEAIMALSPDCLTMLVERLQVHANLPGLAGVTDELKRRLRRHGFHERSIDVAVQHLYGWLWDVIVAGLDSPDVEPRVLISEAQFHAAQCRIRDELIDKSLPVRYMAAEADYRSFAGQKDRRYLRQLDLIGVDSGIKLRSVSAFFRASSERAEWTERGEVLPDELGRYDRELTERWAVEFDVMRAEVQRAKDESEHSWCYQRHFHEVESWDIPIRQGWLHRYLTTGSYHILADKLAVGWHPHYIELLDAEVSGEDIKEDQ